MTIEYIDDDDNDNFELKQQLNTLPWIEKYRPSSLDEIMSHDEIISTLKIFIKNRCLPHLLFYGPAGVGKCLHPCTPVMLYNGCLKKAKEIKPGDILMGDDNTPRNVINIAKGNDIMYKIIQDNGDDYIVNSEHIISLKLATPFIEKWLEKKKQYKLIWFEKNKMKQLLLSVQPKNNDINQKNFSTKENAHKFLQNFKKILIDDNLSNKKGDICDIEIKDYINKQYDWKHAYKGFKCNRITCWRKKNVELDSYMLGYWLGNGSKNGIHMAINDNEILNKNLNWTQDKNTIKYKAKMYNNSQDHFFQIIKKYNLLYNRHIPNHYKVNDVETRMKILAGFLDADGYLNKHNVFEFTQKSKQLFDDIIFIVRSLGLTVSIKKPIKIHGVIYYKANIYGNGIEEIPTKIYRKKSGKYVYCENPLLYKIKVEKLERGDYCGFEIDGNKRFLLGDFTITHNTSCITACAKELYGKYFNYMVMELNASDDRGIEVVRNKIKQFVMSKSAFFGENIEDKENIFKLVILDETDAMTDDAQAILRKVVEKYTNNTRFCLICNYVQNISPALQSRCTRFRFSPIGNEKIRETILRVIEKENIKITESGINTLIKRSEGDMRKVLNILQSTSMAYSIVNEKNINTCLGYPRQIHINTILNCLIEKDFNASYKNILQIKQENGLSLGDIITEIHDILIDYIINNKTKFMCMNKININAITNILDKLRGIEYNYSVSSNENIQLSGLVAVFKMFV